MKFESDFWDPRTSSTRYVPSPPRSPEILTVAIGSLLPAHSPRLSGEDKDHVRRLAEADVTLPPILVHRTTMRVIDGMHRVRAAILKGQEEIEVEFFDGSEEEAFIRSVEENVLHGLPLSLADRKAAALRIMMAHPQLSDRAIAAGTALSAKTVGVIRRRSTADSPQSNTRIGVDGRMRPLSSAEGRRRASEVITARPDASVREVARAAGVSLGTAHDVRGRMHRGEDPLAPGEGRADGRNKSGSPEIGPDLLSPAQRPAGDPLGPDGAQYCLTLLQKLTKDPSFRGTDLGRKLLRLLHMHVVAADGSGMVDAVPPHCTDTVVELARQCANAWMQFAQDVERREQLSNNGSR